MERTFDTAKWRLTLTFMVLTVGNTCRWWRNSRRWFGRRSAQVSRCYQPVERLLLCVLRPGLFQDGNVAVSVIPQRKEILVGGSCLGLISRQSIRRAPGSLTPEVDVVPSALSANKKLRIWADNFRFARIPPGITKRGATTRKPSPRRQNRAAVAASRPTTTVLERGILQHHRSLTMSRRMIGILLFLAIPMIVLNPLGRPAFIGYYVGVISTWLAYVFALHGKHASLRPK